MRQPQSQRRRVNASGGRERRRGGVSSILVRQLGGVSRFLFFPLILVALLPAQTANKQNSACQAAKDQELLRYIEATRPFNPQADQIKKSANQQKSKCAGDQGCIRRIELQEQQELRRNQRDYADENARHEKAMVDIEHLPPCVNLSLPEGPCDRAKAVENRRYSLNSAVLEKRKINDRNLYEHDLINCGIAKGTCLNDANTRQDRRITEWQKVVDAENARHHMEVRFIDSGVGCELPRQDSTSTPGPVQSHEEPGMVSAKPSNQRALDAENKRHVYAVADITRLLDQENQSHATVLKQAGSNAALIAQENELHDSHLHLLQIMLNQEGSRFDAAMARLKGH